MKILDSIILKQDNLFFSFPLLPEIFKIGNSANNKTYNIEGLGNTTVMKSPNLLEFSFSSHFPKYYFIGCQYEKMMNPKLVVLLLEKMKREGKLRLVMPGTLINMLCTIDKFNIEERGGDVDSIYFSISFKEYRKKTPRKITVKNGVVQLDNNKIRISEKSINTTHVVTSGENLYKIAQKEYGDGSKWVDIATKNGITSPYTIYASQKLVL